MTIYKPKSVEKKDDKELLKPEVVTEDVPPPKKKETAVPAALVTLTRRRRRSNVANICVMLTALAVFAIGIIGGIYLYKHLVHRTFSGWCGVRYYEYEDEPASAGQQDPDVQAGYYQGNTNYQRYQVHGEFQEHVEIDKEGGKYEKIDVPAFAECKKATILHDFDQNLTAIVDKDNQHCFIMPLNRTLVRPPKDFWDLLGKLRSGYYLPDAEVVKEKYRVVTPAIENLGPYGYYIWRECRRLDTYKLAKDSEPVALSKRSACERQTFSMGSAATHFMQMVEVATCL